MSRTLLKMKAVPSNAAFYKQLVTMDITMVFRWFSSFSLTAPSTIGITVALISHNFCTCNLIPGIWWFFLVPSLWWFDLQEQLCWWFCMLSSLYQWLQYLAFGVLFPCLFGLQSPKVFYICHFPALTLVDAKTICLHIQSQICCTEEASVLFFQVCRVASCTGFQLGQNTNWPYRWHFQLSLCRTSIGRTRPGDRCYFYCICSECLLLGSTYKAFSFLFQLTCFQPLPPPLILHPLCFSQELTMQCFLFPIFHSLFLLCSSYQSLFLVVTLQLQPLEVSPCCLQHNQRGQIFPVQYILWHSASLYLPELLVCSTCQQKYVGVNLHAYSTVSTFAGQVYPTLPYPS